jgi:hypothetical protein
MNPERKLQRMSASGRVCPEADSIRVELASAAPIARARQVWVASFADHT